MAKQEQVYEEVAVEDDVYGKNSRDSLVEDEAISAAEDGFMQGYEDAAGMIDEPAEEAQEEEI